MTELRNLLVDSVAVVTVVDVVVVKFEVAVGVR